MSPSGTRVMEACQVATGSIVVCVLSADSDQDAFSMRGEPFSICEFRHGRLDGAKRFQIELNL